jgi:3-methyladenine DNA glycosylase AlkC
MREFSKENIFNEEMIEALAGRVATAYPEFASEAFARAALDGLEPLELKARSEHIRDALRAHLPQDPEEAIALLVASMFAEEDDGTGGVEGMGGFRHMPALDFVPTYGLENPEHSLDAIEKMTLYFSAEFAIRPFIRAHPEVTMSRMLAWAEDRDWRLRRLASEGSRPRLPWAKQLQAFIKDPSPTIEILDLLYDDTNLVVRRSAANHLNDISRDNPEVALDVAQRWMDGASKEAAWTVKHAMRTLVKKGNPDALAMLGFSGGDAVEIEDFSLEPLEVKLGDDATFSFTLTSEEEDNVALIVDYALHRALKNGKVGRKVFKLGKVELEPGKQSSFSKTHSFKQLSTRTYYAGEHKIEVLLNGRAAGIWSFEVVE